MATGQLTTVVRYLRRTTAAAEEGRLADSVLLERFVRLRDEAAFTTLIRRHGPMVLGVCRRVLHDLHDAEDAFQATFLVLVRKAAQIHTRASVSSWLHGVASRVALKARLARSVRRARDQKAPIMPARDPFAETLWRDLQPLLDAEVQRLPEKYRLPVVLCYLEGVTYEEAARQLGCPKGTLAVRLARARERLRRNLTRRGVVLSTTALAGLLAQQAASASELPARLVASAAQAGLALASGQGVVTAISARVLALSQGAFMSNSSSKIFLAVLIALGVLGIGPGVLCFCSGVGELSQAAAQDKPAATPASAAEGKVNYLPLAKRVWAILEMVEKNGLEPISRQTMLLDGTKAYLEASRLEPPADLKQQIDQVRSPEDYAALLDKLATTAKKMDPEKLRAYLRQQISKGSKGLDNAALGAKVQEAVEELEKNTHESREHALLEGLLKPQGGHPADFMPLNSIKIAEQLAGNRYVGIGIQISMHKDEERVQIVNPFTRGAAYKAGSRPGDLILEVDGKDTKGISVPKVVEWLRGEEGTKVTIVVRQPESQEKRTLNLTRAKIPIPTVLGYRRDLQDHWDCRVESTIGYAWVKAISSSTVHELRQIERELRAQGAKAIILDFRDSRGQGMLHHAELLAGALLDGEVMWRTRGTNSEPREFRAEHEGLFRGWPMVVLINDEVQDNAQGAVLAALHDNGRAILVGQATQCNGYIKSLFNLPEDKGSVAIRTGRLERVNSADWPVKPDHEVLLKEPERKALIEWERQRELPPNPKEKPPENDAQLAKAVELARVALAKQR